jgi:hypothetical protein
MSKSFHKIAGEIDHHNRQHQDGFELETKKKTNEWNPGLGLSITGMIYVDAMNVHQAVCHPPTYIDTSPHDWICTFAEEMIDNTLDERNLRSLNQNSAPARNNHQGLVML